MELYRCVNEGQYALGHPPGPESEGALRSGIQVGDSITYLLAVSLLIVVVFNLFTC